MFRLYFFFWKLLIHNKISSCSEKYISKVIFCSMSFRSWMIHMIKQKICFCVTVYFVEILISYFKLCWHTLSLWGTIEYASLAVIDLKVYILRFWRWVAIMKSQRSFRQNQRLFHCTSKAFSISQITHIPNE